MEPQSMNPPQNEPLKPLSLMQKAVIGVKSFVKSAISYIPSGLLYAGLMVGGSIAITALTGGIGAPGATDILGLISDGSISMGKVVAKAVGTVALGSVVTGSIGAWKGISAASEQRHAEMEWQQRGVQISPRARGQQRMQSAGYADMPQQQRGLPQQKQTGQHVAPGY